MPFRSAMGSIPGIVDPVNRKGTPLTVTSGMVGQKASVGIASAELNVLGTMPGTTVPSVSTTQMLPRTESVKSSRPSASQTGREAADGVGRVRVFVDDGLRGYERLQLRQAARGQDTDPAFTEFVHDEGDDEPARRLRKLADLFARESRIREDAAVQRVTDEEDLRSSCDAGG